MAEKLRQLYAFEAQAQALELQGFEPPQAPEALEAAPRRIPMEVAWWKEGICGVGAYLPPCWRFWESRKQ